jgi:hypothetical protein
VARWRAEPSAHIVLSQDPKTRQGIPEAEMKRKLPKTFAYFKRFEDRLRMRSGFKQYFRPTDPFYSIYNVGPYTLAPYKVVWREQSSQFQAARITPDQGRIVIPDHKLMAVSCSSLQEADYLTALFASSICRLLVVSYVLSTSTSTHVLDHIAIPLFQAKDRAHKSLATLSKRCHEAAAKNDAEVIEEMQLQIDELAAGIWGITNRELEAIQQAIKDTGQSESRSSTIDSED